MIDVVRQAVARGFLACVGQDPNTYSAQRAVERKVQAVPGKALDIADGPPDDPSPYRDDATAAAARRLLDFHLGA